MATSFFYKRNTSRRQSSQLPKINIKNLQENIGAPANSYISISINFTIVKLIEIEMYELAGAPMFSCRFLMLIFGNWLDCLLEVFLL